MFWFVIKEIKFIQVLRAKDFQYFYQLVICADSYLPFRVAFRRFGRQRITWRTLKKKAIISWFIPIIFYTPYMCKLRHDTTGAPDINFLGVAAGAEDDFWWTVPSCYHVLTQVSWSFTFYWFLFFVICEVCDFWLLWCVFIDLPLHFFLKD